MCKLIPLLTAVLLAACQSKESPDGTGAPGTRTSKPDYVIKFASSGCFGRSIGLFEIRKDRATYQSYNPDDPDSVLAVKTIAWTSGKEMLFKKFMNTGENFTTTRICTTTATYRITSADNEIEFSDTGCELDEEFSALLE